MPNHPALAAALDAAKAAGALLRRAFHRRDMDGEPDGKATADREAEDLIRAWLTRDFPDFGFRAEERPDENRPASRPDGTVWLVDPNDGTSAFQRGYRGASVSIALIRHRRPILGVVYAYSAPDDRGDLFAWAEGCGPLLRNGIPVVDPEWPTRLSADDTVFVSNSADTRPLVNALSVRPARYQPVPGIAYRLALAAAGDGAAAVSLFHPRDFDYAAGHALLRGVGGVLLDERARPITYHPDKPTQAGFCFGGAPSICAALAAGSWQGVVGAPEVEPARYDLIKPQRAALTADAPRLARAQGCWLGALIGDALGGQVAHTSPSEIDRVWPDGVNALLDGGPHALIAGQLGGHGEHAYLLARDMIETGRADAERAAEATTWWRSSGPRAQSRPSDDASPGVLIQVVPLAIAGHAWPERTLVAAARAQAGLTDAHPVCTDGAAAMALAIAFALREGALPERVLSHTLAGAKALDLHPFVVGALQSAPDSDSAADGHPITRTLRDAFHQLIRAEDVANGLMNTVARGGDAAARGAATGALLGAVRGRESLPWLWRDRLLTCRPLKGVPGVENPRDRAFWPVDAMVVAERLLHAVPHP